MKEKELKEIKKRFKEIEGEFDLIDMQVDKGLNVKQETLELNFKNALKNKHILDEELLNRYVTYIDYVKWKHPKINLETIKYLDKRGY